MREPSDVPAPSSLVNCQLGVYHVQSALGAGGMGEVYQARDTRLGRDVAIKVLPSGFIADPERRARFEREARLLASLNHPHIGAIYGVEENAGVFALVLELVGGTTLADRLRRGPLPMAEALSIARQIAAGIEAAHDKGIIHRDLKPANVKVTENGTVKVLDFGIAKVAEESRTADSSENPTVTLATEEGVLIGTAAYMSPEQARGKPVDRRTDIWAFGCVLYEMLAGKAPFTGNTTTDTLAAVVGQEPDWARLPPSAPHAVRRLLRRCLEKDPARRLRDAGDVRIEIEEVISSPAAEEVEGGSQRRLPWMVAAAAVVVALALAALPYLRPPRSEGAAADGRVSQFELQLPEDGLMYHGFNPDLAFSPGGDALAFASFGGVFIRRLDTLETRKLEAAGQYSSAPTFSPDGREIAFIGGNAIISSTRPFLKAALSGGAAVKLSDYDMFHRGDWGEDGYLYWTGTYPGGIVRTPAAGGPTEPVTRLDTARNERSHRFASLLPGGQGLLYTVGFDGIQTYDDARIDLWDFRAGQSRTLITGGTAPVYASSGHIVYGRAGKLFAVPFDLRRLQVTGSPIEVVAGVMTSGNTGIAQFALSKRGDLAYVAGAADGPQRTLVWVDRTGRTEPLPLAPASYLYPRISPDGQQLAVEIEGPNHDVVLYDFERGVTSKVTTDGLSHNPVWAPDGTRFAFRSWQAGGMTMWSMPADRSQKPVRLDPAGTRQSPVSFSPDGRYLSFDQKDPQTDDDVLVLPLAGGAPMPIAQSRFTEGSGKFSPDGRAIAYASDESGRSEVYVQAFPAGPKIQVSSQGGIDPVWRRQGGELYYRSQDGMMTVSISTSPVIRATAPKQLWKGDYSTGSGSSCGMPGPASSNYDVTPDGRRFLMVKDSHAWEPSRRVVVVLNWAERLKRLARGQ